MESARNLSTGSNNNNEQTQIEVCPMGIAALKRIRDENLEKQIKKYKQTWEKFLNLIAIPGGTDEKEIAKRSARKIQCLKSLLKCLAEIEITAGRAGHNIALDVMEIIKTIYPIIVKNLRPQDGIRLRERIQKKRKKNKKSVKLFHLQVVERLLCHWEDNNNNNNGDNNNNNSGPYVCLEHYMTPEVIRYAAHEIRGNKLREDKIEKKNDEENKGLTRAKEISEAILKIKDMLSKIDKKIDAKRSKQEKKGEKPSENLPKLESQKALLVSLMKKLTRLFEFLNMPSFSKKRGSTNLTIYAESFAPEITLPELEREFNRCERTIKLVIEILKNPIFKDLKNWQELEPVLEIILSEYQQRCEAFYHPFVYSGRIASHFRQKLKHQQTLFAMANDIKDKMEAKKLSIIYDNFADQGEEQFIREKLDKDYTVSLLGGGNNKVYLITNNESKLSVIMRASIIMLPKLTETSSPEHVRALLSSSLNLMSIASPLLIIPGGKSQNGEEYRCYEIAPVYPDSLRDKFIALHKAIQCPTNLIDLKHEDFTAAFKKMYHQLDADDLPLKTLQMNVVYYTHQLLLLLQFLEEHTCAFVDIKPSNLLLDYRGRIGVSDAKTLVDLSCLVDESYCPDPDKSISQSVTGGYYIHRLCFHEDKLKNSIANPCQLKLQTFIFTVCELITNVHFDHPTYKFLGIKEQLLILKSALSHPVCHRGATGEFIRNLYAELLSLIDNSPLKPEQIQDRLTALLKRFETEKMQQILLCIEADFAPKAEEDFSPSASMLPGMYQ